jgi:hypothetical protein
MKTMPLAQVAAMMGVAPADALELAHRHHLPFINAAGDIRIGCDDIAVWLGLARNAFADKPDGDA